MSFRSLHPPSGDHLSGRGVKVLWESGRARSLPLPPPTADDFVVYLHIDFDVLDPRFLESVGYPTPGGPAPDELISLITAVG
ncbi:arginase family protein [Nonomuraea sp. NPDC052116]|uniref:arginase family protein n=1 Tax=Nonomuraea sp. NPDC052116 TaxID=3155665 RepID=UPI00341B0F63